MECSGGRGSACGEIELMQGPEEHEHYHLTCQAVRVGRVWSMGERKATEVLLQITFSP